jgi:hypothetical protein
VSAHNRRPHDLAKERRHARIHIWVPPQPTYAVAEIQKKLKNSGQRRHAQGKLRFKNAASLSLFLFFFLEKRGGMPRERKPSCVALSLLALLVQKYK